VTAAEKLGWIGIAVYSAGDTLTRDQALALIAAFFTKDPRARINPRQLAELLARISQEEKPRARQRKALAAG
jgi:hypothetical protein